MIGNPYAQLLNSYYLRHINDYAALNSLRGIPYIGGMFGTGADRLAYQENTRRWADYSKNTGVDLSRLKYPIGSGLYAGSQYLSPGMSSVGAMTGLGAGMFLYGQSSRYVPKDGYNGFPMYG